ncbi:regulator [Candidatus Tenderia electrophaga]|jgi:ligand-binding sensor domain-containing protein|uniref:Regulator n=1 Tax=Candidatus Tenderia electrophaga TaxID=1748243 RepID=A0A0S2THJ1_9GAMM|nr:regulator [Candidatus Tenderia electrophaga]
MLITAALLAGCSDTPPPEAPAVASAAAALEIDDPWQVIDAFEVGRDVYVRALALEPGADRLWVGTSLGVNEVDLTDQSLRNTFTRADGLANEYVFSIFVDSGGYTWMGTNGGGASRYKDEQWQVFFPMHGLADYWVYSFAQQDDGTVWIGTWAGANEWDPDSGEFKTYYDELVNEWVYGIGVDSKQRVWFGTEGGVSMFDGENWQAWTHRDGLGAANQDNLPISLNTGLGTRSRHDLNVMADGQPTYNPDYVFCIHVDKQDGVWAGTWGGGVSRFDGEQWRNYSVDDGLAGALVYSIAEADNGDMWFGTNKGLSRFDGEHWFNYGREDGLLSEHVYSIALISPDEVWVGTRGGVTRFGRAVAQQEAGKAE